MKTISILGTGWLGFPLAQHFVLKGHHVKASTTSENRLSELRHINAEPFIIDIEQLTDNIRDFLQADILIINIPSKNIDGFRKLAEEVERSNIRNVVFISSTSVYENTNKTITEADSEESSRSPLFSIESIFRNSGDFKITIVRFGGLIGYNRNPGNFFKKSTLISNPDSYVNLIHRDDCVVIISQIVGQEAWGEVFNCCADTHPTKKEFYTQAAKSVGGAVPQFAESETRSYKIISNQKVREFLNYEFLHPDLLKINFDETHNKTFSVGDFVPFHSTKSR